jgi:hypothetical protein
MRIAIVTAGLLASAACGHSSTHGTLLSLRDACDPAHYWDGTACKPRGDGAAKIAAGKELLAKSEVTQAKAALDAADHGGPLDHDANVSLWEQRGLAAAYLEDEPSAAAAFDMMLSLDPAHFLSYTLSPKATFVFEKVRNDMKKRGAPVLDVNWSHGQRVGDPVPLDVEVVADPKKFLHRATVFVRTRGETSWHAADLTLGVHDSRVVLPGITAQKPTSLELYLRAYDDRGNEVLAWADPTRPREIPLRYDPPTKWYRKWWVYAIAGSVVAAGTGVAVYELTIAPPDKVTASSSIK